MQQISQAVFFIALLTLTSCATIFGKKRQIISFDTNPSGATVFLNGKEIGQTPLQYEIGTSNDSIQSDGGNLSNTSHHVVFQKQGYANNAFNMYRNEMLNASKSTKDTILCFLDAILIFPLLIDLNKGSCNGFDNAYYATLQTTAGMAKISTITIEE